ncbi:glycosyltransferase [Vibrio sp. T187]|uniref:glycosyltransferase family 4 protein n=1 Tax=Vibrio TaxID=662 RepID=UPI0010C9EEC3|nr:MULTISPECIES: glycosyltransferase family 4 protein [Vibrio]MBW3697807.1 glycosyltransferase [Vibrio sp. T187]
MSAAKPDLPDTNEIWLLLDSQIYGGIESHVLELALGLISHQFPVRIILINRYHPTPPILDRLVQADLPYSYLNDLSPHSQSSFKRFTSAVYRYRPTLVHAHGYKASLYSKVAKVMGVLKQTKQVSTYHAGETPTGRVWVYDWCDRYTSFISNHSLVVSEKIRAKIPTQSTLLNNFVAQCSTPGKYSDHIGFVGRLSHEKGPDRFVALANVFTDYTFDIYGDGPELSAVQEQATSNLRCHGHQSNMADVWHNIGVLIITSRFEGLPMAALEAMGRGIPVISLSVGNLPNLIDHKENGFLANNMDELKHWVEYWLQLPEHDQCNIRQNAIKTIHSEYSPQAVIPKLVECYFPSH